MQLSPSSSTLSSILHQGAQVDHLAFTPRRHGPTVLYQLIQRNWLTFLRQLEESGRSLPRYVTREFEDYIQCGSLANGFLRLKCDSCRHEKLIAFSCKRRGFCASCSARRMSENAAFFVDQVLPQEMIRQWVLSVPIPLRYWMAKSPSLMTSILAIYVRAITSHYSHQIKDNGIKGSKTGSITLVQRFGGAINLNIHFHTLIIEGVYEHRGGKATFHPAPPPTDEQVRAVLIAVQKRVVRFLKKARYIEEKEEGVVHFSDFLGEDTVENLCSAASVQQRIALGERAGKRVRRLGGFGEKGENPHIDGSLCFSIGGFSLHANVAVKKWLTAAEVFPLLRRFLTRK